MADDRRFATLKEVAEELGVSYRQAWSAAHSGKLPAFQPFGKRHAWVVCADYGQFICKAAAQQEDEQ